MKTVLLAGAAVCALALPVAQSVAQPIPVVMCRIGSTFAPVVPERVCKALMSGAAGMVRYRQMPDGSHLSECRTAILEALGLPDAPTDLYYGSAINTCGAIYDSLMMAYSLHQGD